MVVSREFDLASRMEEFRRQREQLSWNGTFAEYFDRVVQNPSIAQLSHARVYQMIQAKGVESDSEGNTRIKFFEGEIFGLEKTLAQLYEYFKSAAGRSETRKRILLLMGPVGGGKSTIVTLLKKGLEVHSQTDEGAVYAICGCPMHEEPLHLIPDELRTELKEKIGLHIEGDLCPKCRLMVDEDYGGRIENVPVERIAFSEKFRRGIGTFSPSDPKSQDIAELTGSIDLATVGQYGAESDPRAYRFDGELNVANRGLMEFIEMLKCDDKFLYGLLTLSQEQSIKTGRFALIYADEVVVSHTNEAEYNAFVSNPKNEALKDRIIVVKVPYNLRVSDEVRIYRKLVRGEGLQGVHIAPRALEVAASFAVLSRLESSKKAGMSLVKKMKVYDGQDVEGFSQKDVKELREEAVREGMDGISPRFVVNMISTAVAKSDNECITPIDLIRSLRDGFEQHTGIKKEDREKLLGLLSDARKDYDEWAKTEVQKAFVYSFEEAATTLLNNYLDNVEAFCEKKKVKDPVTGEDVEPDEKLMRSLEEQVVVNETSKKAFREEILIRMSSLFRKGAKFDYRSHDKLREAIEKKLFADLKDVVKITTSIKTPDEEQLKKMNDVINRLVEQQGFCVHCANSLLKYVGTLLSR